MRVRVKNGDVEVELEVEDGASSMALPASFESLTKLPPTIHDDRRDYDRRMGIQAAHHLTVDSAEDATWIIDRCRDKIADKTVVEIGAGVGYLAVELAKHAQRVFAIEVDVKWSWEFTQKLYATKPRNLTWIFDRAESVAHLIHADVAIIVTGSDHVWLRELGKKFAPEVIMPWQDWNEGRARIARMDDQARPLVGGEDSY